MKTLAIFLPLTDDQHKTILQLEPEERQRIRFEIARLFHYDAPGRIRVKLDTREDPKPNGER